MRGEVRGMGKRGERMGRSGEEMGEKIEKKRERKEGGAGKGVSMREMGRFDRKECV